jgi:hypothetical protein
MAEENIEDYPGLDSSLMWDGEPTITAGEESEAPITRLAPNSKEHEKVLDYLLKRLDASEKEMTKFYARWVANEIRLQAYVNLPDYQQQLKEMNDRGEPPKVVNIVVPYIFATHSTILTYLLHAFTSRSPLFQVSAHQPSAMKSARQMEMVLQYQAEHMRLVKQLYQFLHDGLTYGVGILRTRWEDTYKTRTVWKSPEQNPMVSRFLSMLGVPAEGKKAVRETRRVYSGNESTSVDPFMFFPDPNVPMHEVNRRGEFVFWRSFEGKHMIKAMAADGLFFHTENIGRMPTGSANGETSVRNILAGGNNISGELNRSVRGGTDYHQIDQGSVTIIPAELGLGSSDVPEKWLFTIINKNQIVQAEPLGLDHDMHPVAVAEPYSQGYGFGNAGLVDYLGPVQDTLSWYINSHVENVRATLNNILIVNPSMIEMGDLTKPGPGKLVRLKSAAYGQDVRSAISQLPIVDVTSNHLRDFEALMRSGDIMSSVTDNVRGMQDAGGRKSATEARQSIQAATSRLASLSRLISSQAITDLTEQLCLNTQQFLDDEFYFQIAGPDAAPIHITPEMLVGDFHFPINDGTLPLDRIALLDVWKDVFLSVAGDQQLRQEFDVTGIFKHLADLAGAKELKEFKLNVQVAPEGQIASQAQAGNFAPTDGMMPIVPGGMPS